MSKPLKKIIDAILMEAQKFSQQLYDRLPDQEYFIDKANTWRSLIVRDLQRGKLYPMPFYQTATYNLKRVVDEASIDGVEIKRNSNLWSIEFPEIVDNTWADIAFLGTDKAFSRKNRENFNNLEGNEFTSHMPCYLVVSGQKAYIRNMPTPSAQIVKMVALHVNPLDVHGYDYEMTNYPISDMYLPKLEHLLKKELFTHLGLQVPGNSKEVQNEQQE